MSVYYFERLACAKFYYFYERSLPAISGDIFANVQFAIAANHLEYLQRLYTELEKNIDASRTNSVDELLSGEVNAINNTSRSLARNFGAESYIPKYVRDRKDKACTAIR
jgi:hypothetical protein